MVFPESGLIGVQPFSPGLLPEAPNPHLQQQTGCPSQLSATLAVKSGFQKPRQVMPSCLGTSQQTDR